MVYIIIYEQVYKILESHTNLIQKKIVKEIVK